MLPGTSEKTHWPGRAFHRSELPFGGRLGPYVLLEQVGAGRWCRVFRAVHRDGKGLKAVKLLGAPAREIYRSMARRSVSLGKHCAEGAPGALALLRREAEVAACVEHPKLVVVEDAQLEQPPYFLVLEWIEGESLAQRIARQGKLFVPVALWIARQVAEALDALFQAGFIHGDVKPQNVLVRRDGGVKLIDLGLARRPGERFDPQPREATPPPPCPPLVRGGWGGWRSHASPIRSEKAQPLAGTANYMAPELAAGTHAGDARSDLYSLGVTLYEMLTGRLPFIAQEIGRVLELHRRVPPPAPRSAARFLTPQLTGLLRVMLAKDSLRRPYPPAEFVRMLRRLEIEWIDYRDSA